MDPREREAHGFLLFVLITGDDGVIDVGAGEQHRRSAAARSL